MAGTQVGSGWTNKAVRHLLGERFGVTYGKSGVRKLFAHLGWSYQRGRKLYIRRDPLDQERYEEETYAVLAKYARNGQKVVPLASDQSKVYLEGTLSRRWKCRTTKASGATSMVVKCAMPSGGGKVGEMFKGRAFPRVKAAAVGRAGCWRCTGCARAIARKIRLLSHHVALEEAHKRSRRRAPL